LDPFLANEVNMAESQAKPYCRPPRFKIDVPGDDTFKTSIMTKIANVRNYLKKKLGSGVTNATVMENVLMLGKRSTI
jgi:hypothetical protein